MKGHVATLLITIGFLTIAAHSQTPVGLEGKWEGTLVAGPNQLRIVLNITRASDGLHLGTMINVDQGGVCESPWTSSSLREIQFALK